MITKSTPLFLTALKSIAPCHTDTSIPFIAMLFFLLIRVFFITVMQLLQSFLQLSRNRKSKVGSIFNQGQTFIRDVEEDDCRPQDTSLSEYIDVEDVCDADQNEDQHLAADAAKADRRRELLVVDCAHDTGDVVADDKDQQRIEQAVATAKEVAKPASNG